MTDGLPPFYVEWIHECHELIKNFSNATCNTGSNFRDFIGHWKYVNFKLMNSQHNIEELPVLVHELYSVGKHFLFSKQPLESRIGGLYMLYALYFTQPTRNKIRLTLNEVKEMVTFLDELKRCNMYEPQFTFYKLFVKKAFIFASTPNQFISQKDHSEENVDIGNLLHSCKSGLLSLHGLSSDKLNDLEKRLKKYKEIKSQIPGFCTSNSKSTVTNDFFSKFQ